MPFFLRSGQRDYIIVGDQFVVGRGTDVELSLVDDSVSRRHASFRIDGDTPTVVDLQSRNGTLVNGQPIVGSVTLEPGDVIFVGQHRFVLIDQHMANEIEHSKTTQPLQEDQRTALAPPALAALSKREREVLELLAAGVSQKEIGEQLGLSIKTVQTYRTRLGQKLNFQCRADMVRFALQYGILKTE